MNTEKEGTGQAPDSRSMHRFWRIWSGQVVSLFGSQAVQFALIWWLTSTTGSATILAVATLVGLLPQVVLGPFIGALVDRWDRRRVMLAADGTAAAAAALLAAAFATGQAGVGAVLALLFVRALCAAFHAPAVLASTPLMVPEQHLTRVQGLNQAVEGGMLIVAAPIGAFLYTLFPMAGVMLVDVATALIAIAPLSVTPVPSPRQDHREALGVTSVIRDVVAGFRYLRERTGHIALLGLAAMINVCLVPAFSLLPLLVSESGGDATRLGFMTSMFGIGTLAGGIALGVWGGFRSRIRTTLTGLVALGVATCLLGSLPAAGAFLAILIVGAMAPLANGPIQAILQATIAPEFQGRVFTLYGSIAALAAPLGLVFAAPVAELIGIRTLYAAGGLACVVLGAAGFFVPAIMGIEEGRTVITGPAQPSA